MRIRAPEQPVRPLSEVEIEAFRADGAVRVRGVISDEWLARITEAVEFVLANPTVLAQATAILGGGGFSGDAFMWKTHDGFRDFMFYSLAARLAQQALGSETVSRPVRPCDRACPTPTT